MARRALGLVANHHQKLKDQSMLNKEETLQLRLATRDAIISQGLRVSPSAMPALDAYLATKGDVVSFGEDGAIRLLGEELPAALTRLATQPGTNIYFDNGDDGAAAPVAGDPPPKSGGGGDAADAEKARQTFGYSQAEWGKLSNIKKWELTEAARGASKVAGNKSWRKNVAKVALKPEELAKFTPEQKIALGNEAARPEGFA